MKNYYIKVYPPNITLKRKMVDHEYCVLRWTKAKPRHYFAFIITVVSDGSLFFLLRISAKFTSCFPLLSADIIVLEELVSTSHLLAPLTLPPASPGLGLRPVPALPHEWRLDNSCLFFLHFCRQGCWLKY